MQVESIVSRPATMWTLLLLLLLLHHPFTNVVVVQAQDTPPVCNRNTFLQDPCTYSLDGFCDAGDDSLCEAGTDCLDCDPCTNFHMTSCEECTSSSTTACAWCATEAACFNAQYLDWMRDEESSNDLFAPQYLSCKNDATQVSTSPAQCAALEEQIPFTNVAYYYANEWIFDLINIKPVWERGGITGQGVSIRINDDGVDASHPDFAGRFDVQDSCDLYTPYQVGSFYSHGTTCASIAAGSSQDSCTVGIAPQARLSACRMIEEGAQEFEVEDQFLYDERMRNVDISSNSWGPVSCFEDVRRRRLRPPDFRQLDETASSECPFQPDSSVCQSFDCSEVDWANRGELPGFCRQEIAGYCVQPLNFENDVEACSDFFYLYTFCYYAPLENENEFLERGITEGRDGKGVIYVFSSGNDYATGEIVDRNADATVSTRYAIPVGGVGKDGLASSFSTGGPAAFISAPSGDSDHFANHVTALNGGGCYEAGEGTSYAAPVVSGVAALLLQVRPELTWRDVRGILATTAYSVEDPKDDTWVVNAAGMHFSDRYGFGIVDASAAVSAAETWKLYDPEQMVEASSGPLNIELPDYTPESDPLVTSVVVSEESKFVIETVYLFVRLDHNTRGDLKIVLTAPSGTASIVHPGKRLEVSDTNRWKFVINKLWGESPTGEWTLSIEDEQRYPVGVNPFEVYYDEDDYEGDDGYDDFMPANFEVELLQEWSLEVYGRFMDNPTSSPIATPAPIRTPPPPTRFPTFTVPMHKGVYKGMYKGMHKGVYKGMHKGMHYKGKGFQRGMRSHGSRKSSKMKGMSFRGPRKSSNMKGSVFKKKAPINKIGHSWMTVKKKKVLKPRTRFWPNRNWW